MRRCHSPRRASAELSRAAITDPADGRVLQHLVSGATAGIAEHIAMYPVDTVKTRMQALGHPGQRASSCVLPAAALMQEV